MSAPTAAIGQTFALMHLMVGQGAIGEDALTITCKESGKKLCVSYRLDLGEDGGESAKFFFDQNGYLVYMYSEVIRPENEDGPEKTWSKIELSYK